MDGFIDEQKKTDNLVNTAITVGLSLAILYGLVYVAGRAFKKSQTA